MIQSNASNKTKGWIRGLVGGFISGLLGGTCFGLFLYEAGSRLEGVLMFLCLGFGLPAFIKLTGSSNTSLILKVSVFWFLAGAAIGYFIPNNLRAIAIWFLVYAISLGISIVLFANMMN
jgi:uncharacterized membrane protein